MGVYLNFSVLAKRTFFNALTIALCFIITGCSGASSAIKSQRPFIPNQIQSLAHAQVIATFPESNPSSREYVNNRGTFKAYKGRGKLLLQNESALSADIYINNKKLALDTLQKNTEYAFNLGQYIHNGVNTFKVDNIQPADGSLTLRFAFATLNSSVAKTINFSAVDKLIEKDVSAGFPGAVLAVIKAGKILKLTAYGDAKQYQQNDLMLLRPEPMQTNTLFDLASNTKIFATNFALMKLVSEGQLNINNRVSDYLTEYQGDGRELRQVKDLLTHKAGYPPVFDFHRKDTRYGEAFFSQASDTTKQLLLTSVPLASEPSAQHVYSDIDYMILGVLIERISGQPLDEYLEQHIYAPLKLNNTLFNPLKKGFNRQQFAATELSGNTRDGRIHFDNIRTNVLQGQVHDERAFYSLDGVAGHAGLFSNAPDLAVLCQVLLNKGGYSDTQIFNASSLAQFLTPQSTDETYGLGFRLAGNNQARRWHFGPYASPQAYGHTGWTGTVTVIDPAYDLAIILLTNARHSPIKGSEKRYQFVGKNYETAQYGSIVSLIYEALLNQ